MNTTNRLWHVAAAVGLALLALVLTAFYVTNYKRHVQHGEAQVTVLVATKDIPVDTQGSVLVSGSWLTKETVARRQVVPGAVSSPNQIRNLIAIEPVYAGEQVTARRFGTAAERGVRAQIKGTQRAIEVAGDAHQLLAGTLRVSDHVDIVAAWERDKDRSRVSRVIIRDALVLAAPATPPKGGSGGLGPNGGFSAQLRMTDAETQKLDWIIGHGKEWRLEVRPPANSANSPQLHETGETMLTDGPGER